MAINRRKQLRLEHRERKIERERRKLGSNSLQLRSGKNLPSRTAIPPSTRRSDRHHRKQPASLVFADPDLIAEEAAHEEPQRREDGQGSHDMSSPSSENIGIRTQALAMGVHDGEESLAQGDNPTHLGCPSHLQGLGEMTSAEIDLAGNDPQPTRTSEGAASEGTPYEHVEDFGIPIDDEWGIEGVRGKRLCGEHGEEWLLKYCDRWMSPCDFNFGRAEAKLKKMLQHHQSSVSTSKPQEQASTVECNCSYLWSEVNTPVRYDDAGGKYLIRWKLRWTPGDDIPDLPWVKDLYESQNVVEERHCSD